MSSTTHNILIVAKTTGLDQVNTSVKGLTTTTKAATQSTDALGSSWSKSQTGALKLNTGVQKLDKSEGDVVKTTDKYTKSTDKAGKSTSGLAAKFQGNKGLIFATVGIATAGLEAVGMFQQYQNAAAKVSEAQARLNQLERLGQQDTKAYADAQRDLTDANRGAQFALRILTLSVGDLIPFTLLLINSGFKLKETLGSVKTAVDATSQATTAMGKATQAASAGGLTQVFNSAGRATTGMNGLDTSFRNTTTTSGQLLTSQGQLVTGMGNMGRSVQENTKFVGTRGSGLVGGLSALSLGMGETQKSGSKFTQVFSGIGTSIKSLPATFANIGSSIFSFFTNFGTHLGKLPGLFKTAGAAVVGFGRAITTAFLSNPIGLILVGISAAVIALITDFGGFRTAINAVGKAVGDAIPFLKGILDWFGQAANGALDAAAGLLGFDTQAKKTAAAAAEAKLEMDPLLLSLQKYIDLGPQFQNLNNVITLFANMRKAITELHESTEFATKGMVLGLNNFGTAFETAMGSITNKTPQVEVAIRHVQDTLKLLEGGGYTAAQSQEFLTLALDALSAALGKDVTETKKDIAAKQESAKAATITQNATLGLSNELVELSTSWQVATSEGQKMSEETNKNVEMVKKYVASIGSAIPPVEEMTEKEKAYYQTLLNIAPFLENYSNIIKLNSDQTVNWTATTEALTQKHQAFADQTSQDWSSISSLVSQGVQGYKQAVAMVELLGVTDKERGKAAEAALEHELEIREQNTKSLSDMIDTALKGAEKVKESEEKQMTALQKTREEIKNKATELNILDKIQGMSTQNQQNAIKITEEQNKVENTAILTLQKLATARGLDISKIEQSSDALLNHIVTSDKLSVSMDEINAKIGELIAARQENVKASEMEEAAQTQLLATMNKIPPIMGMTGKGLAELVTLYDDTANATSIAADEVGIWITQLQKEQAIEKATLSQLQDYAKQHDIVIPAAIANNVEKTKEYISIVQGIGPAAKKAADEALKAFEDITGKAKSQLESIISDTLGEDGDNVKKAIKGIEKIGLSLDSLTAKQHIINIFLNDENFENDIASLGETMIAEFGRLENFSTQEATQIGDSFIGNMISEIGSKAPGVANTVNAIWTNIKNNPLPGETGDQMIGRLVQALQNIGPIENSAKALGAAIPTGVQQGATPLQQKLADLLGISVSTITGKSTQFETAGQGLGTATTQGVASGLQSGSSLVQNATLTGVVNPITGQIEQVPGQAGTALQPIEGVFSQAFLNASVAATGQINLLLADITLSMGFLVTNIGSKLTEIQSLWISHATNVVTPIDNIKTHILSLQQGFSILSTSVATYMGSMATNVGGFATKSVSSFNTVNSATKSAHTALSTMSTSVSTYMSSMSSKVNSFGSSAASAFNKIKSSAASATSGVKQLQSAINSLKDKTVTITVRYRTVGGMEHGGAFLKHAQHGITSIVDTPTTFGGVRMGEGFKKELVTVTPLTRGTGNHSGPTVSSGGSTGGGNQPMINNITVVLDGRVIQRFVEKTALQGFGLQV